MPAGAAIGFGAIGTIGGLMGSNKAAKSQKKFQKQMMAIMQRQVKMAEEQWDTYKTLFKPIDTQLSQKLQKGPDFGRVTAAAASDTMQAYERGEQDFNRNLTRYGINPSSGKYAGLSRDFTINRAKDVAGAMTTARDLEDDRHWARSLSFALRGGQFTGQAMQGMAQAGNTASQGFDMASQQLKMYQDQTADSARLLGSGLAGIGGPQGGAPGSGGPVGVNPSLSDSNMGNLLYSPQQMQMNGNYGVVPQDQWGQGSLYPRM